MHQIWGHTLAEDIQLPEGGFRSEPEPFWAPQRTLCKSKEFFFHYNELYVQ